MNKLFVIGGIIALGTAYFILKKMKQDKTEQEQQQQSSPEYREYIIQQTGGITANILPPYVNDYRWSAWRTDVNPTFAPLVDQFNAYSPYNLRPIYGSIRGSTDYYATHPVQTYYYDNTVTPDFLLPPSQQTDLINTRREQALYGNLSRYSPWSLKA